MVWMGKIKDFVCIREEPTIYAERKINDIVKWNFFSEPETIARFISSIFQNSLLFFCTDKSNPFHRIQI